jgi:hypothetical protein
MDVSHLVILAIVLGIASCALLQLGEAKTGLDQARLTPRAVVVVTPASP